MTERAIKNLIRQVNQRFILSRNDVAGIYMWTNKVTGLIYIGQTTDLTKRKKNFLCFNHLYGGRFITRARQKYNSREYWFHEVLEYCNPDPDELNEREIYYIEYFKAREKGVGYNIALGGSGSKGNKFSEESRLRASLVRKKKVCQIDPQTMEVIKVWDGMIDIQRELGYDSSAIAKVCKGKFRSSNGYLWKYEDGELKQRQSKYRKKVIQYTKDGKTKLNEFESQTAAAKAVNGNITNIAYCCKGVQTSYRGFVWRYAEGVEYTPNKVNKYKRKISQYTKDGIFVREFDSLTAAALEVQGSPSDIQICCKIHYKTFRGFKWRYSSDV